MPSRLRSAACNQAEHGTFRIPISRTVACVLHAQLRQVRPTSSSMSSISTVRVPTCNTSYSSRMPACRIAPNAEGIGNLMGVAMGGHGQTSHLHRSTCTVQPERKQALSTPTDATTCIAGPLGESEASPVRR